MTGIGHGGQNALRRPDLEFGGDTPLFSLAKSAKAAHIHDGLARNHFLTRKFSYRPAWLRFGLPGSETDWLRVQDPWGALT